MVILGNCFLPLLILLGIGWGSIALWTAVKTELKAPVEQLIADARNLAEQTRAAAQTVENSAEIIRQEAVNLQESANAIVKPLTSFSIDIPAFDVPFLNVKACDMNLKVKEALNIKSCFPKVNVLGGISSSVNAGLRRAFARPRAEFEKISASVQRARNELDKLSPLADAFRAQAREFEARAEALAMARDRVSDRIGRIVEIIGYVMVVLGLWAMLTYLLWIQNRLATGWHMLRQGTGAFIRR